MDFRGAGEGYREREEGGVTTTTNGWNIWNGGERPVGKDTVVDIRLRNGIVIHAVPADRYLWTRPRRDVEDSGNSAAKDNGGVIVAYRELEEIA